MRRHVGARRSSRAQGSMENGGQACRAWMIIFDISVFSYFSSASSRRITGWLARFFKPVGHLPTSLSFVYLTFRPVSGFEGMLSPTYIDSMGMPRLHIETLFRPLNGISLVRGSELFICWLQGSPHMHIRRGICHHQHARSVRFLNGQMGMHYQYPILHIWHASRYPLRARLPTHSHLPVLLPTQVCRSGNRSVDR